MMAFRHPARVSFPPNSRAEGLEDGDFASSRANVAFNLRALKLRLGEEITIASAAFSGQHFTGSKEMLVPVAFFSVVKN